MLSVRPGVGYNRNAQRAQEPLTMADKLYEYLKKRFIILVCLGVVGIILYRALVHPRRETTTTIPLMGFSLSMCKTYLERRYQKTFLPSRPQWLVNDVSGERMELDLFNEELGIACCYQDVTHYEFPSQEITQMNDFQALVYRDGLKKILCAENNIRLIVVPYTIKYDIIPQYIVDKLK